MNAKNANPAMVEDRNNWNINAIVLIFVWGFKSLKKQGGYSLILWLKVGSRKIECTRPDI